MRKRDLELLEVRLEPLQTARDRVDEAVRVNVSGIIALRDQVRELQRNEEIHKTEIAQGLASIRSLLQRANRAARETGIVEEDETLALVPETVNTPRTADQVVADARAKNAGRTIL